MPAHEYKINLIAEESPVISLPETARRFGLSNLLVKRDDLLSPKFGGCKIRGLELQLFKAAENKADTILIAARAGSNAIAALSIYAREHGLKVCAIVKPQVFSSTAHFNLLVTYAAQTEIVPVPSDTSLHRSAEVVKREVNRLERQGRKPYFIGFGGSDIQAAMAQITAVEAMSAQLADMPCTTVDRIYIGGASFTTAAGISAGLTLLGKATKLVVVGLAHEHAPGAAFLEMAKKAADSIREVRGEVCKGTVDMHLPDFHCSFKDQFGISAAPLSIEGSPEVADLRLDPVYTRKVFAYMLSDAGEWPGRNFLFWHTGNSRVWPLSVPTPVLPLHLKNLLTAI